MNWTYDKATLVALSECGYYRISGALNNARIYWNAIYLPSQRSIDGSYDKDHAKTACEDHAKRIAAQKVAVNS